MSHMTEDLINSRAPVIRWHRQWGCQQSSRKPARALKRLQLHTMQAGRQAFDQPALDMDTAEQMRRLGEESQEAFASGNPETLNRTSDNMMEVKSPCSQYFLSAKTV